MIMFSHMEMDRKELTELVNNNLEISDRWRRILSYRWGLGEEVKHTLNETGKFFGVSRQRIFEIEKKAFEVLGIPKEASEKSGDK